MNLNYPSEQTNETLISDMSVKPQVLNHEIVRNTNSTEDKHIMLTIGPEGLNDSYSLFEINSPGGMQSQLMTSDVEFAIRAHLQELESHNLKEEKAIKSINNIDLNINIDDLDNQSQKDRAKHIVNTSKYLYNKYGVKSHILFIKKGNWRNKNPSEEITKQAYDILDEEDRNTQACYQTAFLSCLALRAQTDINNERISYCEGIAIPKYGGLPNKHAWVEIDNQVMELTWPWSGPYPVETSLYYGFEIEWDKVNRKMRNRPTYASVLISDEEYYSNSSVIRAIQRQNNM